LHDLISQTIDKMYISWYPDANHGAGICTPTFTRTKWPSFGKYSSTMVRNWDISWYINGLVIKSISQPEVCNTCCMNMSKFHNMSIYTIYGINIQY
jgi:hypothetical protein